VPELRQHTAHFAVLPLRQHHLENRRLPFLADDSNALRLDLPFGEPNPFRQLVEDFTRGSPRNHRPVQLLNPELGMRQLVGKLAVVRQQDEAHAHLVEPPHGINALGNLGQQVHDARPTRGVIVRRDVPLRFGDSEVDHPLGLNPLAVEGDLGTLGVDASSKLADHLIIDGNPALEDQLLARASRTDPGVGQHFLEPIQAPLGLLVPRLRPG